MADIELLEGEEWRPVVGYEGMYEVSNMGRVRSIDRTLHYKDGRTPFVKGQLLSPVSLHHDYGVNGSTYQRVKITKYKHKLVHVLVAEAFIGPRPEDCEVMHINGIRNDNRVENLRYGTKSENSRQSIEYSGRPCNAKLSVQDVHDIRKRLRNGEKPTAIAKSYPVSSAAIQSIKSGKNFSWLKEGEYFAT